MTIQGFWGKLDQFKHFSLIQAKNTNNNVGLRVEPNISYSQHVKAPFHVTMASLTDIIHDEDCRTSICVNIENKNYALCTLTPNKVEQQLLDIFFVEGEYVTFMVDGKNPIHLTGNYVFPNPKRINELDTTNTILKSHNTGNNERDHIEELAIGCGFQDGKKMKNKRKLLSNRMAAILKENMNEQLQEQIMAKKHVHALTSTTSSLPKKIMVKDIQHGIGPACKNGQRIKIKVTGKLINGKVITEENETVSFELGKGVVIKGWDLGIVGMRVGGKRKLTIPPSLTHGKQQGLPPNIPENSTLIFYIDLISIT